MALPDYLEDTAKDYAKQSTATYGTPIETSTFTGGVDASGQRASGAGITGANPFIAGMNQMQTDAMGLATQGVGSYAPFLQSAQGNVANAEQNYANQAGFYGNQAGLTGPNAYQNFMSPYQQQVIDTSLADFDSSRIGNRQAIQDQAVASGNFGGGREGAMMGQYNADSLADRAALQGSMLERGFGQANQLAQQNFANQGDLYGMQQGLGNMQSNLFGQQGQMGQAQQGLANAQQSLAQSQLGRGSAMANLSGAQQGLAQSQLGRGQAIQGLSAAQQGLAGAYGNQMNQQFGLSDFNRQGMGQDINALGSLGAANQAQQQAILNANSQNQRTAAYEPYGRLTQYGNMITGLGGGMSGGQYQQEQGSNPYQTALGTATGLAGLYGSIFGKR